MITLNPAPSDRGCLNSSSSALNLGEGLSVAKIKDPEPKIEDPALKIKDLGVKLRARSHKLRTRNLKLRSWALN